MTIPVGSLVSVRQKRLNVESKDSLGLIFNVVGKDPMGHVMYEVLFGSYSRPVQVWDDELTNKE